MSLFELFHGLGAPVDERATTQPTLKVPVASMDTPPTGNIVSVTPINTLLTDNIAPVTPINTPLTDNIAPVTPIYTPLTGNIAPGTPTYTPLTGNIAPVTLIDTPLSGNIPSDLSPRIPSQHETLSPTTPSTPVQAAMKARGYQHRARAHLSAQEAHRLDVQAEVRSINRFKAALWKKVGALQAKYALNFFFNYSWQRVASEQPWFREFRAAFRQVVFDQLLLP